ncbi:sensor histidine kinase [Roseimarinus sediminis]|uniref:sensor histidine kinase n=1 Tax=Roseimarinus sediminis TaxID=1610899 RepID=UPI003D1CF945
MDKEIFEKLVNYPFVYKGDFFDSEKLPQHKNCIKKCKDKDCLSLLKMDLDETYYRCKMGFDNFRIVLNDNKFLLNGLIYRDNKVIAKGRRDARREYLVSKTDIDTHFEFLKKLNEVICKKIFENIEENISVLHDVKTSVGIVTSCAEGLINSNVGNDFHEKLNNSPQLARDLYDAIDLVNSQLAMIDILVNTQSITQGNKYDINIYQLFHRVAKLFRHRAEKKSITIQWRDNGHVPAVKCYDSIGFVPIILLDNAIKYSEPNTNIMTFFTIGIDKITVVVSSYGPIVKKEFRELIFEKYERGENAQKYCKDGIGVGLWICKKILEYHESNIYYHYEHFEKGMGYNKFEFEIYLE